jgi:hypothetical protein
LELISSPPQSTLSSGIIMNVILSAAEQQQLLKQSTPKAAAATINFYETVPGYELSLDEFELFALKRLKVRCIYAVICMIASNVFFYQSFSLLFLF